MSSLKEEPISPVAPLKEEPISAPDDTASSPAKRALPILDPSDLVGLTFSIKKIGNVLEPE